jgi:hypothetical protein
MPAQWVPEIGSGASWGLWRIGGCGSKLLPHDFPNSAKHFLFPVTGDSPSLEEGKRSRFVETIQEGLGPSDWGPRGEAPGKADPP